MSTNYTVEEIDEELLEYVSDHELVRSIERRTGYNVAQLIDAYGIADAIDMITVELDSDCVWLFWLDGGPDDDPFDLIPPEVSERSTAERVVELVESWR